MSNQVRSFYEVGGVRVSRHAMVRWIERVERCDLGFVREELRGLGIDPNSDAAILAHLLHQYELDLQKLAERMVTEAVRQGVSLGAVRVNHDRWSTVIEKNYIVTVMSRRRFRGSRAGPRYEEAAA